MNPEYRARLSNIMSREYSKAEFATPQEYDDKKIGVLTREFGSYSQFHQGSGESLSLDFMSAFSDIPNNALILIDEIEASLHPKAQRRLLHNLFELARLKSWQVVMSTHSPYILEELPDEARTLLIRGENGVKVVPGASVEFCLSALDDRNYSAVNIFLEDAEAVTVAREIIANMDPDLLRQLSFHPVGPCNVVKTLGDLSAHGKLPYRSVAILDGDETHENCHALPGNAAPERQVFPDLQALGWPDVSERMGIGPGDLFAILDEAMLDPQHHRWTSIVGDRVVKSKAVVWDILASIWVRRCLTNDAKTQFLAPIRDALIVA